jgi:glycosyltransferase involved in cell wall biosynthesis
VPHEENILIADTPADFAAQTIRMMTDPELWQRIANSARRQVEVYYDWRIAGRKLIRAFEDD